MEELQQRFQELEAQLERRAEKAGRLRDQGLHELAEREDERWKAVSEEYVMVATQIADQKKDNTGPRDRPVRYTHQEWLDNLIRELGQAFRDMPRQVAIEAGTETEEEIAALTRSEIYILPFRAAVLDEQLEKSAAMEELQQRFQELEAQLGRHADKAKYLRDQGLHELADREDQRWKEVSKEYATVGSQIENLRPKSPPQSADYIDYENVCRGCLQEYKKPIHRINVNAEFCCGTFGQRFAGPMEKFRAQ